MSFLLQPFGAFKNQFLVKKILSTCTPKLYLLCRLLESYLCLHLRVKYTAVISSFQSTDMCYTFLLNNSMLLSLTTSYHLYYLLPLHSHTFNQLLPCSLSINLLKKLPLLSHWQQFTSWLGLLIVSFHQGNKPQWNETCFASRVWIQQQSCVVTVWVRYSWTGLVGNRDWHVYSLRECFLKTL